MRLPGPSGSRSVVLAALAGLGLLPALGQLRADPPQDDAAAVKNAPAAQAKGAARPGGLRVPGGAGRRQRAQAADPLAPPAGANPNRNQEANPNPVQAAPDQPRTPVWPFHYSLKIAGTDGQAIQAAYYPAKVPFQAPALILLHETGRGHSSKDFEEPIEDLKGKSLVKSLQDQGFALLTIDLRGHGGNPRHPLTQAEVPLLVTDVQAGYLFLVDRHNRGELNLGKLGVIGVGEAANVAAAWAASAGSGTSSEGRLSDLGALVLVSPVADAYGLKLGELLPEIATRFPILAVAGDKDEKSIQTLLDHTRVIERHRAGQVAYFNTSLHGSKLISFFPKVATGATAFLEEPVKARRMEWEPRFLFDPVVIEGAQLVAESGFADDPRRPLVPGQPGNQAAPRIVPPAANPVPRAAVRDR